MPPKKKPDDRPARLLAVFERQRKDGTYAFADEDVRELVPLMFLASSGPGDLEKLSPALQNAMMAFASRLGIGSNATPKQLQKAIDGYYAENPVNPELLAELRKLLGKK